MTDPIGRKVKTIYDAAGQVTQVIKAFGSALQQNYATTTYSPNGQVLTVTDARGYVTKNEYDGFDRPTKLIFPDGTPANDNDNLYEATTYDAGSRKLTSRTRAGQVLTYGYDDLDRVTSRTGGSMPDRTFAYDLAGRASSVKDMNGATTVAETQYVYDTAGRLTRERRNDWNQNVDFQLDAGGNRTRLTWPDAFYVSYVYDGLNRPTSAATAALTLRTYAYDHRGRRSGEIVMPGANQTATTYTFENDNDLAALTHNYPGATLDLAFTHTYSPAGQLLTKTTSEALNRYAEASALGTQAYSTANPLNQYPGVTPIGGSLNALSYDLNGNMTGDGSSVFTYDATNRLLSISGFVTASYGYDALDRRMSKTTGGATTRFLHAGSDEIAEYTSAGALLRRYVPGPGADERVAMIDSNLASPPATAMKYPLTDRQGSVMAVTSSTGAVTERFAYDGFGRSNSSLTGYPFRYTGQRLDPETGLMFYKACTYSTSLGRFLQTDPIGTKDDLNLYAYVGNDAVNRSDPTGMCAGGDGPIACRFSAYRDGPREAAIRAEGERQGGIMVANAMLDATPVVGDLKTGAEFIHAPTLVGGAAVIAGVFSGPGDFVSTLLRRADPNFFRGAKPGEAPSFAPKPSDFKVDRDTGFVKPTHGVSVYDNADSVIAKGFDAYRLDLNTVSERLQIIQRGKDPRHFEITPRPGVDLTPEQFTKELECIQCMRWSP